ncbi:MAG: hypothetical protein KJ709_04575 [Nanoarchaeota archaeon]|nr:hypothetical protein [Nanoarchaeota archaeon]
MNQANNIRVRLYKAVEQVGSPELRDKCMAYGLSLKGASIDKIANGIAQEGIASHVICGLALDGDKRHNMLSGVIDYLGDHDATATYLKHLFEMTASPHKDWRLEEITALSKRYRPWGHHFMHAVYRPVISIEKLDRVLDRFSDDKVQDFVHRHAGRHPEQLLSSIRCMAECIESQRTFDRGLRVAAQYNPWAPLVTRAMCDQNYYRDRINAFGMDPVKESVADYDGYRGSLIDAIGRLAGLLQGRMRMKRVLPKLQMLSGNTGRNLVDVMQELSSKLGDGWGRIGLNKAWGRIPDYLKEIEAGSR